MTQLAKETAETLKSYTYPISEVFDSIQGEGRWAGTPMRFIRLAGCNVGQRRDANMDLYLRHRGTPLHILDSKPEHTCCQLWDRQLMLCDTDYRSHSKLTSSELIKGWLGDQICVTGGEPFLHDLSPLVVEAQSQDLVVHIETSGTKPFKLSSLVKPNWIWITCSPKQGFLWDEPQLASINELKMIVTPSTKIEELLDFHSQFMRTLNNWRVAPEFYLQPVALEPHKPAQQQALKKCLDIIQKYPMHFALSIQMHKYWEVR